MVVVDCDLQKLSETDIVQVDSDAEDNVQAVLEIEKWAAENGFVRTNEYWLRQVMRDQRRLFRGICYRLTKEEIKARRQAGARVAKAVENMPKTPHDTGQESR